MKLIIIYKNVKHEISKAQDLFNLYNEWYINSETLSEEDYEIVSTIWKNYKIVFEKIEKKEFRLFEFENMVKEIMDKEKERKEEEK